jgi:hypothetical protein
MWASACAENAAGEEAIRPSLVISRNTEFD